MAHWKHGVYLVIPEGTIFNSSVLMTHLYNLNFENRMRFEVFMAVKMLMLVLWVVPPLQVDASVYEKHIVSMFLNIHLS
jgi:hypothetical protein